MASRTVTILVCDKCEQDISENYVGDGVLSFHTNCLSSMPVEEFLLMAYRAETDIDNLVVYERPGDRPAHTLYLVLARKDKGETI